MNCQAARRILILLLGQAAAFAYPVITTPLLIRRLGISEYGVVMYAFSCVLLAGLVVDFGFNLSALDALGKAQSPQEQQLVVDETLGSKFLLWGVVSLSSCVVGLAQVLPHLGHLPLLFPVLLLGNVFFPPWLLQGLGLVRELTALNVLTRLACLALVVHLVQGPQDVPLALILQQAPMLLSAPAAWAIVRRRGISPRARLSQQQGRVLRTSTPMFVSALASGALNYANSVALGMYGPREAVGQYNAGTRVAGSALTALTPVQAVVLPMLSSAAHDHALLSRMVRRSAPIFILLYASAGLGLTALASPIAQIYLHDGHTTTIDVLRLLGIGVCAAGVEVWAYSSLIAVGRARTATITYLAVAGVHVVCALSLAAAFANPVLLAGLWAASSCVVALALGTQALMSTRQARST